VIDNDLWVGMLLVDAPVATCKAFRAHVRVVGLEDAPDLAATTFKATMRTLTHLLARRQRLLLWHVERVCCVSHSHG
jgi:hypothetical protein